MSMQQLGHRIKEARDLQHKTLKALAQEADLSAAYIQKLENAEITSPSPHKLQQLADALGLSYIELMQLAEYITAPDATVGEVEADGLSHALRSANLSNDQREEVAQFISFLKSREQG